MTQNKEIFPTRKIEPNFPNFRPAESFKLPQSVKRHFSQLNNFREKLQEKDDLIDEMKDQLQEKEQIIDALKRENLYLKQKLGKTNLNNEINYDDIQHQQIKMVKYQSQMNKIENMASNVDSSVKRFNQIQRSTLPANHDDKNVIDAKLLEDIKKTFSNKINNFMKKVDFSMSQINQKIDDVSKLEVDSLRQKIHSLEEYLFEIQDAFDLEEDEIKKLVQKNVVYYPVPSQKKTNELKEKFIEQIDFLSQIQKEIDLLSHE